MIDRKIRIPTSRQGWSPLLATVYMGAGLFSATAAMGADEATATESAGAASLEEIVVSAQRRQQTVQDVALNVQAYTGDQLKEQGINSVTEITKSIPNVQIDSYYPSAQPNITIRGMGMGAVFGPQATAGVGIYYDDVYMGARDGQMAQMFDLERVEVLLGPQGTLYGRNTTAGAINFISKKPGDRFEADASVTYGRWNEVDIDGGLTLPASDTLSFRVAGVKHQRDGWMFNTYLAAPQYRLNDIDDWGARALALWKPTENMSWLLNLHGGESFTTSPAVSQDLGSDGTNGPNTFTGYVGPTAFNQVQLNSPVWAVLRMHGVGLTGNIDFGDIRLTSITGYDYVYASHAYDQDGSPFDISSDKGRDVVQEWSQELRLSAKHGPFDWVAGLYMDRQHLTYYTPYNPNFADPTLTPLGLTFATIGDTVQNDSTAAAFGDLRYSLTNWWTLEIGARYTYEKKAVNSNQSTQFYGDPVPELATANLSDHWGAPSGRVALEYRPETNILAYGSYGRGFKGGGLGNAQSPTFAPEYDNAYELGLKTSWFENRLILNADVFYNQLYNAQELVVTFAPDNPLFPIFSTKNAAQGTSYGAEFEIQARPMRALSTSLNVGLLRTHFGAFQFDPETSLAGNEFTQAPKLSFSWHMQYEVGLGQRVGSLTPNLSVSYKGGEWYDPHEVPGLDHQGGYTVVDGTLPWHSPNDAWEVSAWVRNMMNKHYYSEGIGINGHLSWGAGVSYHAPPRSYGITVAYRFR